MTDIKARFRIVLFFFMGLSLFIQAMSAKADVFDFFPILYSNASYLDDQGFHYDSAAYTGFGGGWGTSLQDGGSIYGKAFSNVVMSEVSNHLTYSSQSIVELVNKAGPSNSSAQSTMNTRVINTDSVAKSYYLTFHLGDGALGFVYDPNSDAAPPAMTMSYNFSLAVNLSTAFSSSASLAGTYLDHTLTESGGLTGSFFSGQTADGYNELGYKFGSYTGSVYLCTLLPGQEINLNTGNPFRLAIELDTAASGPNLGGAYADFGGNWFTADIVAVPAPEPLSLLLTALGLIGLMGLKKLKSNVS